MRLVTDVLVIGCGGAGMYAATVAREMTLEPLRNKPRIRDLVSDIVPPAERLLSAGKD